MTKPITPSTLHLEYHSNQIQLATKSTVEAAGIIRSIAADGRFLVAVAAVITTDVARVIAEVLAVVGIGRGAIVILLSTLLRCFISFTAIAIAAIITDEQMP